VLPVQRSEPVTINLKSDRLKKVFFRLEIVDREEATEWKSGSFRGEYFEPTNELTTCCKNGETMNSVKSNETE